MKGESLNEISFSSLLLMMIMNDNSWAETQVSQRFFLAFPGK